ncbi:MAG: M23 family metallopeptidase [Novosphingobium sp.]|nr:M23 family metallopeptidase [Novosphingobium sp.]
MRLILSGLVLLLGAASATAVPPGEETEHVVEAGETLYGIANRAGISNSAIIKANDLDPPYVIRIGQTLTIPRDGRPASRTIAARSPAPATTSPSNLPEMHVVAPGETLGGIAARAKVPRVLIAEANRLKPPYTIKVGQKLLLPRTRRHTVEKGDTGFNLSYRYAVPWENIAIANGMEPDAALPIGKELLIPTVLKAPAPVASTTASQADTARFTWPLTGSIRRAYRARADGNYHDGIDIEASEGAAVRATAAGTVTFADKEKNQFGNLVVIDHGNGWHSAYGSLGRVTVKKGDQARQGERVGLVGDTSVTKRTELHFELRRNGQPVDPVSELPETE